MSFNKKANVGCNTSNLLLNSRGGCDKVVIEVNRVFDACMKQFSQENVQMNVEFPGEGPFTFVSGSNVGDQIITNLTVTPQAHTPCSRVRFDLTVPLQINATNNGNQSVVGFTEVTFSIDVMLKVPKDAITPSEIKSNATVVVVDGTFDENVLTATLCVTIITKVIAEVDLIIHTAGYPIIPECEDFAEDLCAGVFNRPVYPLSR